MGATRILVLEHGEIAESGCHEELLELQGTYARMVRSTRDGVRPRSAEHELDFEQDGAKAREN
jgi:ABC-type transport system involved in cytochrome bd biosynthesis fused ATPase/permease subunit